MTATVFPIFRFGGLAYTIAHGGPCVWYAALAARGYPGRIGTFESREAAEGCAFIAAWISGVSKILTNSYWSVGIECTCWRLYRSGDVGQAVIIQTMVDRCGGWVCDDDGEPRFVPLARWEGMATS